MRALMLLIVGLLAGLAAAQGPYGAVKWSTFQSGTQSRISQFTTQEIRTEAAWQKFWATLTGGSAASAPKGIDWNKELLVAVCLGERRTGGFTVEIDAIKVKNADLVEVFFGERTPLRGEVVPQVISSPWVVARMNRLPTKIGFVRNTPRERTPSVIITGGGYGGWSNAQLVSWRQLHDGVTGGNREGTWCLSSADEYARYVREIFPNASAVSRVNVDWSREVVVAIHLGNARSGIAVGVHSVVVANDGSVVVNYGLRELPYRDRDATQPFVIFAMPRVTTVPVFRFLGDR